MANDNTGIGAAGSVLSSAFPLIGSALGTMANMYTNNVNNQLAQEMNRENIYWNNYWNNVNLNQTWKMFNKTNQMNNPSAQMERLKSAGLNPHLIYGNGAQNEVSAVSLPRASAQQGQPFQHQPIGDLIAQGFMSLTGSQKTMAQTELYEAQKLKVLQDVQSVQQDVVRKKREELEAESTSFERKYQLELEIMKAEADLDYTNSMIEYTTARTAGQEISNRFEAETYDLKCDLIEQSKNESISRQELNATLKALNSQKVQNLIFDEKYKKDLVKIAKEKNRITEAISNGQLDVALEKLGIERDKLKAIEEGVKATQVNTGINGIDKVLNVLLKLAKIVL